MAKIVLTFVFLWGIIAVLYLLWRDSTPLERLKSAKVLALSGAGALVVSVILFFIVHLF